MPVGSPGGPHGRRIPFPTQMERQGSEKNVFSEQNPCYKNVECKTAVQYWRRLSGWGGAALKKDVSRVLRGTDLELESW